MDNEINGIFIGDMEFPKDLLEEETDNFGTVSHFKDAYRERINNFLSDFLHSNIEVVIKKSDGNLEEVKSQINNLVEVYYQARVEFDKNKNKLYGFPYYK